MNTSSLIIAHLIVVQLKCELHVLQVHGDTSIYNLFLPLLDRS